MREYPSDTMENLRRLTAALARDATFGKDVLHAGSLIGGGQHLWTKRS